MAKKKLEYTEAVCSFCQQYHTFDTPCKSFVCTACRVAQTIVPQLTARQSVGNNKTGHYRPPGTSHR